MKPIEGPAAIQQFFSDDFRPKVSPRYQVVFEQFLRYHRRQLNEMEFGVGTNACKYEVYRKRQNTMKRNSDARKKLTSSLLELASYDPHNLVSSRGSLSRSQLIPAQENSISVNSNKPEGESLASGIQPVFVEVLHPDACKDFTEDLAEANPQFTAAKKELLQLDRFNYEISKVKKCDYKLSKPIPSESITIFKSDFRLSRNPKNSPRSPASPGASLFQVSTR
jgi:hypothetical protein